MNQKPKQLPKKRTIFNLSFSFKNIALWVVALWLFSLFIYSSFTQSTPSQQIPLSQAMTDIKDGKVDHVTVADNQVTLNYKDNSQKTTQKEPTVSFAEILQQNDVPLDSVKLEVDNNATSKILVDIAGTVLPLIAMVVIFYFIFRQARGAQDSIFSFGRSRAKVFSKGKQNITFTDVAGVKEAKDELVEIVDFLKNPGKYRRVGARTPKGVLLVGPSGVGKTLLAKAVAGEAGVPFFSMAGSEFMEMLVGVGASRVRDLFDTAKKTAPSIIFIDEIDAIGRQRGNGLSGGHDEREQTLNQILVEMDGFTPNDNVVVLAATNRGDLLDPALLRPGRFDRRVTLDMPDIEDRKEILAIHAQGKPFVPGVDWDRVAKATVGFSGADLENMLNEAAIMAARNNRRAIEPNDIEESELRVKLGPEKKRLQSDDDRKLTAYHEAGHAVVSFSLPHVDPVHRISIVSRGLAMGFTLIPPRRDRYNESKSHLLETIVTLLGGRAAEELVFKEFTSGAGSDIDKATMLARQMVVSYGMSSLGPIYLGPQYEQSDSGRSWIAPAEISQEMQFRIDNEIKSIIDKAYIEAIKVLKGQRKKLDVIAEKLLEQETIEGEEFDKLMNIK
jgi:cell division protease FtsH